MSNNVIMLFMPWKGFLRISGDISSKLIQLSKELNNVNESMSSDDIAFRNIKNKSIIETILFLNKIFIIFILLYVMDLFICFLFHV